MGGCLCLCQAACSSPLAHGIREYDAGRYPEALAVLRASPLNEHRLSRASETRYALYRGLVELAVGNACQAYQWLSITQRAVRRDASLLSREDRGRLTAAWRSLGKMPGQLR